MIPCHSPNIQVDTKYELFNSAYMCSYLHDCILDAVSYNKNVTLQTLLKYKIKSVL